MRDPTVLQMAMVYSFDLVGFGLATLLIWLMPRKPAVILAVGPIVAIVLYAVNQITWPVSNRLATTAIAARFVAGMAQAAIVYGAFLFWSKIPESTQK